MTTPSKPKLTIELIPGPTWESNVRTQVDRSTWDLLRRYIYGAANYRCEICGGWGSRHPVECHEVWEFDEVAEVQRLVRLQALCPACHGVKHFGRSVAIGREKQALEHLSKVNGWTQLQTRLYLVEEERTWQRRSRLQWSVNIDALKMYGIPVKRRKEPK